MPRLHIFPEAKAMPTDLKLRNRMLVLGVFQSGREYTIAEIAATTGLSRQTVMKAIQFFVERQLLLAAGKGSSTDVGGKKPELYIFNHDAPLLSIAIWPYSLCIVLSNLQGVELDRFYLDEPIPDTPEETFEKVKTHTQTLLAAHGYVPGDVFGVGISIPGTIQYSTGTLKYSSQMPKWGGHVPVLEPFADFFGDESIILVENAGKMTGRSVLGEKNLLDKRVMVLFSTFGLSACLIEKGTILNGVNSLIGEIGHMIIDPRDEELCGCGSRGCLEVLVSIRRIRRNIRECPPEKLADSELGRIDIDRLTVAGLFDLSRRGDALARELVTGLAWAFALMIRHASLTFDPELVIFQGDYACADEVFYEQMKKALAMFPYYPQNDTVSYRFDARPLHDLNALGAFASLQNLFFGNPSLYQ